MAAEAETSAYPRSIFWRGLRFNQVPSERDELVRYKEECKFCGAALWQWNSAQWGARFPGGSYSVATSIEDALLRAASAAIAMKQYEIGCLRNLIDDDGDC